MQWYISKLVYQIIRHNHQRPAQFDEQLRLIQASSKQEAYEKANLLGLNHAESFLNNKQERIEWKFISVCELLQLGELHDGLEVYSRIEEKENADSYLQIIQKKSTGLNQKYNATIQSVT